MWGEAREIFSVKELLTWELKDDSELANYRGERAFQVKEISEGQGDFKKLKEY